jgi:hypothetical protein
LYGWVGGCGVVGHGVCYLNSRHCEERSDAAIQGGTLNTGLLRYARNDE